jgi:stearoyl-CoA desaturase (Delta-9 desaturase)
MDACKISRFRLRFLLFWSFLPQQFTDDIYFRMKFRIPFHRVNWPTSIFLMSTMLVSVTAVPVYLVRHGIDWFQAILFLAFFCFSAASITLGYHRLFSHLAFQAKWPVKLFTLFFGASAFEGSALEWSADHRRHHKHVDHDEDPYDISKGFFHAHIGWLLFKLRPEPPMDNVADLRADPLVRWQHRLIIPLNFISGFILPTCIGWLWGGPQAALGSFLLAGVLRTVCVQHSTFFINSLCHTIGNRPYSSRCSARDSWLMAVFTFGEGYHNYHHEFQHDYRNGVKPWQFDPTKWTIWTLNKLGLASNLRRVPAEKIILAEIAEKHRLVEHALKAGKIPLEKHTMLEKAQERLHLATKAWEQRKAEYARATEKKIEASKERLMELKHEFETAAANLRAAIQNWQDAYMNVVSATA